MKYFIIIIAAAMTTFQILMQQETQIKRKFNNENVDNRVVDTYEFMCSYSVATTERKLRSRKYIRTFFLDLLKEVCIFTNIFTHNTQVLKQLISLIKHAKFRSQTNMYYSRSYFVYFTQISKKKIISTTTISESVYLKPIFHRSR